MIVMIILMLLALLMAGSIESNLREAFSGDWMRFDEPQEPKADMDDAEFDESSNDAPDLDNSEYDWGHNVKGYKSEEE